MISMGTEVSVFDLVNIKEICDQVLFLSEYRAQLYDSLKNRMNTIAPNFTALVGELVGAHLIAHGSTVPILGAKKALFRALKTKHATPQYGLIYHASLIGQAAPKLKGKISQSFAAKTALAIRYDALGDDQDNIMGLENRAEVEAWFAGSAKGKPKIDIYDKNHKKGVGGLITADSLEQLSLLRIMVVIVFLLLNKAILFWEQMAHCSSKKVLSSQHGASLCIQ
ncbi:unnamed protein product [Prunus brigantina]